VAMGTPVSFPEYEVFNSARKTDASVLHTSAYCIFVPLPEYPGEILLVHGYTGAYDLVDRDVAQFLYHNRVTSAPLHGKWQPEFPDGGPISLPEETMGELITRGYLTTASPERERQEFRSIAHKIHSLQSARNSYVLVPTYDCNLRCVYCFQDHMRTDPACGHLLNRMTLEIADRILSGIQRLEDAVWEGEGNRPEDVPKNFTFFGGEPLLAENVDLISHIVSRAQHDGPSRFSAITNGTELEAYRSLLSPEGIRNLQITLDGPPRTHDQFRMYAGGSGSFEKIARNIDLALDQGVNVNVRVNVCRENARDLSELAEEVHRRKWPGRRGFSIYAAPIQATTAFPDKERTFGSLELGQYLQKARQDNSALGMFRSSIDDMRGRALALFRNPEIDPMRDFQATFCGAHGGMYVFDPFGDIYACWERMGDPRIRVGFVDSTGQVVLESAMLQTWRTRTVASNPVCERCPYALHCGGGCAIHAEAANGSMFSNYCDGFAARFKTAVAEAFTAAQRGGAGALADMSEDLNKAEKLCG
jgi:uncharacterized protein